MEKTYALSDKAALRFKLWPALITLCGIFLIWAFEVTPFSIVFAVIATGFAWWRSGYVPHLITIRSNGHIQFKSFLKEIEIRPEDIHAIVENTYYREIAVLCGKGRIAIPFGMPNIMDFIETVQQLNPNIAVKLGKLTRSLK
ncbi:MAG: hypothetical protein JRI82_16145 [Deltaproteobacteria bacterium]|nr:hypothetical protein [Deltaproteobacteria bacterium]